MSMLDKLTTITLNGNQQLRSILLFGAPGTGKTSIASHFAK
jgi:replication-associated recombination protein RarA